jgi:hypothetical protein
MKFMVKIPEVYDYCIELEAENKEDAREKALSGNYDGKLQFVETIDGIKVEEMNKM